MNKKKIFNFKLAQYLVSKGHKVLCMDKGRYGDQCYVFEATEQFMKDFSNKTHANRNIIL
jgi:hypothetical protein